MQNKDKKFIGEEEDKIIPIRLHKEMYDHLRRYSFEHNISIAQICREGVELFFKKSKEDS